MANLSDRLRAVPDAKARGRLRVAEVVTAFRGQALTWVGANGWTFVLDAEPTVKSSARDAQRVASQFDLTVRDGARVVFRDRILAWDGTPVMVPDGTKLVVDGVEVDNFREDPVLGARMDIEHTVRVATKDGTVPHVKAKPGTVSTFYAGTTDGVVASTNATYLTARTGSGLSADTTGTTWRAGQGRPGDYFCWEGFAQWDTSAIADTDTVSAAVLSLWCNSDASATEFTTNCRLYDWSTSLTTADWVAGESIAGTLLATFASAGVTAAAYNDFTDVAFPANVSLTGATRVMFSSDRFEAGTSPTGNEYIFWSSADVASTTQDPKLVVTHAAAPIAVGPLIGGKLVGGVLRGRLVR